MNDTRYLHTVKSGWPYPMTTDVKTYARDSGGDNQEESVAQQQGVFKEFIPHYGLSSSGDYADESGLSSTTEGRADLEALVSDVQRHYARIPNVYVRERLSQTPRCVIIVWKLGRLSRDPELVNYIRADFALRGVVFLELSEPPPSGLKMADEINFLIKRFSDYHLLKQISEDAKRGQAQNISKRDTDPDFRRYNPTWPTQDGRYLSIADGKPPVGFKGEQVRIGTHTRLRTLKGAEQEAHFVQRLVPDETLWARCRLAWDLRQTGHSLRHIHEATHLFKTDKSYSRFFANRIYTGDYEHGGQIYHDFVPALIPREWYDSEQQRRTQCAQKRVGQPVPAPLEPRRVASRFLLSGKVFCEAVAGELHAMHGHTIPANTHRTEWTAYECAVRKHTHNAACTGPSVSATAVHQALVAAILRDVITRETLRPLADALTASLRQQHTTVNAQLLTLTTQIAEREHTLQKIIDVIASDTDTPSAALLARLKVVEKEKAVLIAQKHQLERTGNTPTPVPTLSDARLDEYVARVRQVLSGSDVLLARRILEHFVDKVIVKGRTGTLYYTFPFEDLSTVRTPPPEGPGVRAIPLTKPARMRCASGIGLARSCRASVRHPQFASRARIPLTGRQRSRAPRTGCNRRSCDQFYS